ncbi:MAG TPA: hypothetical protein ACFYD6_02030 [Candidatus Brocadiia bacterium]|nr:hypothetical protein [Candidatus Brocadiales bacterium]
MFEEDIFKDAKYCVSCNKFYITNFCPFCTPKTTTSRHVTSEKEAGETHFSHPPIKNDSTRLHHSAIPLDVEGKGDEQSSVDVKEFSEYKKSSHDSKIEELSLEIERLRHENKEKKEKIAKEIELKFNILADKFERLSKKEKEYREQAFQALSVVRNNGNDTQTELLKERIKELNAELEQLQQRNEEKDRQVLQSIAEASKLSGVVEQQKDELERLWFDIQEKDRVIMQISLTLSSAISQALTQREVGVGFKSAPTKELTTPHPFDARPTTKQDKHSRKVFYALLGGLNVVIISHLVSTFLYKRDIVSLIIEFFKGLR